MEWICVKIGRKRKALNFLSKKIKLIIHEALQIIKRTQKVSKSKVNFNIRIKHNKRASLEFFIILKFFLDFRRRFWAIVEENMYRKLIMKFVEKFLRV